MEFTKRFLRAKSPCADGFRWFSRNVQDGAGYQQALELNDQVPLYMGAEEYGRYATEQTAREKVFVQELGIKLD